MSQFNFMNFNDGCSDTEFVAKKDLYTKEEAVEICNGENDWLLEDRGLRKATIDDIEEATIKYFVSVPEHCYCDSEKGCYTYCNDGTRGSFKVWVINFNKLQIGVE